MPVKTIAGAGRLTRLASKHCGQAAACWSWPRVPTSQIGSRFDVSVTLGFAYCYRKLWKFVGCGLRVSGAGPGTRLRKLLAARPKHVARWQHFAKVARRPFFPPATPLVRRSRFLAGGFPLKTGQTARCRGDGLAPALSDLARAYVRAANVLARLISPTASGWSCAARSCPAPRPRA